jgi:hypothetical protein
MRLEQDLFIMMIVGFILISVFLLSLFMKKRDKKELDVDLETLLREEETAKAFKGADDLREEAAVPYVHSIPITGRTRTGNSSGSQVITVNFPVGTPNKNEDVITKEAINGALEGKTWKIMTDDKPAKKKKKTKKKTDPNDPHVFKYAKWEKGKLVSMWGCTGPDCLGKEYKHGPSAHKHVKTKHK